MFSLLKILFTSTLLLCTITSCSNKNNEGSKKEYSEKRIRMEAEAQKRLALARQQLANHQGVDAKETIEKMRTDCYLALDARNQGILLMDSIDLSLAQEELAEIDRKMRRKKIDISSDEFEEMCNKVNFYRRKMQFDRNQ